MLYILDFGDHKFYSAVNGEHARLLLRKIKAEKSRSEIEMEDYVEIVNAYIDDCRYTPSKFYNKF